MINATTLIRRAKKVICDPWRIVIFMRDCKMLTWMKDASYLRLIYRASMHKKLNLDKPITFNEKLQWLKLYHYKPVYTQMADKYEAKDFIRSRLGKEYVIPTLGVWEHFDEIDFDQLPEQFVLKCTHDSGGIIICKCKQELDTEGAKEMMERRLAHNYFFDGRERPYKDIHPRIIAEPYMEDHTYTELRDYKFYCFHGKPKLLLIATGRQRGKTETKFDFYDMDGHHLDLMREKPNAIDPPALPYHFKEMQEFAAILSKGVPFVRVDFYEVDQKLYCGELTFFPGGGMHAFQPEKWDHILGDWIRLPARRKE